MGRIINTSRIYKLIRNLIIFVSISSLILGIIRWNNFGSYEDSINETIAECEKDNPSYSVSGISCGQIWSPLIDVERNMIDKLFLISFFPPIVFFGGKTLINYIAPVVNKKNK